MYSGALCQAGAKAAVIQYDDGTAEETWRVGSPYSVGMRFDLPTSASYYLNALTFDVNITGAASQVQISVLDPNNGFSNIVSPFFLTFAPTPGLSIPETSSESFDVSSNQIVVSKSFLIGVHWLQPDGTYPINVFLGYDQSSSAALLDHSYDYNCAKWAGSCWGSPPDPTGNPTNPDYGLWMIQADVQVVPLPGALPLFAIGLVGLGLLGWRGKKAQASA